MRAPSLQVLHLTSGAIYTHLSIRWENITDLALSVCLGSDAATPEVVRLLSTCTSLRQCTMHSIQFRITDQIPFGNLTVVLPYLHTLNLQFRGSLEINEIWPPHTTPQPISAVFDAISAPRLTHLSINIVGSARSVLFDTTPFLRFVERSGCVLSSLQLQFPVASDGLISLLHPMPRLSAFTLRGLSGFSGKTPTVEGSIHLIRALTPGLANTDVLCPLLEEITWVKCVPEDAVPLLSLAEARCESCYEKEVVKLKRCQ